MESMLKAYEDPKATDVPFTILVFFGVFLIFFYLPIAVIALADEILHYDGDTPTLGIVFIAALMRRSGATGPSDRTSSTMMIGETIASDFSNELLLNIFSTSFTTLTAFYTLLAVVFTYHHDADGDGKDDHGPRTRWSYSNLWKSPCLPGDEHHNADVYSKYNGYGLPIMPLFSLIMAPFLLSTFFFTMRFELLVFNWSITIVTVLILVALLPSLSTLVFAAFYIIQASAILLSIWHRNQLQYVVAFQATRAAREEAERISQEEQREMKHMIANVAHDLKTPLSSFMTGVDIIGEMIIECKQNLDAGSISADYLESMVNDMQQCLQNVRITNSFMMMTINRCIDYTKASKGMKLVPKYETFDLQDTLSLPLNCMKNIQNTVQIVQRPISEDIVNYIISDKQWLQENVLCLLSNAVKYSKGGEVTVSVSLEKECSANGPMEAPTALLSQGEALSDRKGLRGMTVVGGNKISPDPTAAIPPNTLSSAPARPNRLGLGVGIGSLSAASAGAVALSLAPSQVCASNVKLFLRVEIEDMGIGMSEESMAELFSPFKQNQRLAGGTGLGLFSLAKRVEVLKGRCGVMKRRDGRPGSLFWFTVPYRPDEDLAERRRSMTFRRTADTLASPAAGPRALNLSNENHIVPMLTITEEGPTSGASHVVNFGRSLSTALTTLNHGMPSIIPPAISCEKVDILRSLQGSPTHHMISGNGPKWRILLVDDAPSVLKMTSMILSRQGHQVTTAENGAWALDIVEGLLNQRRLGNDEEGGIVSHPVFDIILLDLQMPVMDGLETVRRLRKVEKQVMTPSSRHVVIGLSANSDDEVLQETYAAGFDFFLSKPFSISRFLEAVEEIQHKGLMTIGD
eukprot:scaffold659_cov192-Ochromonas_danica.AAC.57